MKYLCSRWWRGPALATAVAIVVACGGGGGDSVVPTPVPTTSVPVTLLAGSLQRVGTMDGTGIEAQFDRPHGLAADPAGNIYIGSDSTIRKMDPRGVVTTIAGMPYQSGTADGVGSAARFYGAWAVAADGAGNVYVGDNGVIRKIYPGGIVTTLAGTPGQYGGVDGPGPAARFSQPQSIALDSAGNLFVADTGYAVRKVSPDSYVSTFAGKMGEPGFLVADGGQARFQGVVAVAVDAQDRIYVAEGGRLRRFDNAGHALPWGAAPQGVVTLDSSMCRFTAGMAIAPNGDLIVACTDGGYRIPPPLDQFTMQVLRVTPAGTVSVVAGHGLGKIDGPAAVARFNDPSGIAIRSDGSILVSEIGNHAIRQIDTQGIVSTVAGGTGEGFADGQGGAARFSNPTAVVAAPNGNLYVADQANGLVRRVSLAGNVTTLAITRDDGSTFGTPGSTLFAIAVATDGTLYVSEFASSAATSSDIGTVDSSGRYHVLAPNSQAYRIAAVPGGVYYAVGVAAGNVGIQKLLNDGTKQIIASGFKNPQDLVVDAAGIVYVADFGDHTVRAIDAQGNVRLVAGKPGEAGYVDGSADQARLDRPSSLAIDDVGNLYVADTSGTIRKISGDGRVSTVAGTPGSLYGIKAMAWRAGMIYATVVNAVLAIGPLN